MATLGPTDYGPIYAETNLDQLIVEPFNTISNLVFLFIAIYWWRQRNSQRFDSQFKLFLTITTPILFIGWLGGSIYHATRSHILWLILDVGPIAVLATLTAFFFWLRILINWKYIFVVIVGLFIMARFLLFILVESKETWTVSASYFALSIPIIIPVLYYEFKSQWRTINLLGLCLGLLVVALSFRLLDSSEWVAMNFPVGTHWLWHLLGGLLTHSTVYYASLTKSLSDAKVRTT